MSAIKDFVFVFFPPESIRGKWLKQKAIKLDLAKPYVPNDMYQHWIDHSETYAFVAPIENGLVVKKNLPTLSIIIPMFNTKDKYLAPLLYSIINQSYGHWELILADASTDPERSSAIKATALQDKRITYVRLSKNEGISGNTNQGLKHVRSDYVVFMDHDDTLNPHALNEVVATIIDNPGVEIMYSDEDKITDDGTIRHTPHFKPEWSPHQYLSCNWTSHLSIIESNLVKKVGGLKPEMDGAQDYDLILRLLALPGERTIIHIPKVLYHWRLADGSTAGNFDEKGYAVAAGVKALTNYIDAKGWDGTVEAIKGRSGFHKVKFNPKSNRKVLVILNASSDERLNNTLLGRMQASSSSTVSTTFITKQEFDKSERTIMRDLSDNDHIFTINGYYSTLDTKWLDELSGILELSDVRAVSPRILTMHDIIKDMGVVIDGQGQEQELFQKLHRVAGTVFGHTEWVRDVARVTGRFYGANKLNWITLRDNLIVNDSVSGKKTYDVVWSHINFQLITENIKRNKFFHQQLLINEHNGEPNVWVK
jgi:glycosyltransferase involved in cell wall biosynthesis